MSWSRKLAHPVGIAKPKPRTLNTLADARRYMLALKDGRERREYWQHTAKLLLEAAEGGSAEAVTKQINARAESTARSTRSGRQATSGDGGFRHGNCRPAR